jgi:hypothetical protein
LIPSDQYDFITEKFIKKDSKPVDYTDKRLDQQVNQMLTLVEIEKKQPNPNYESLKFN